MFYYKKNMACLSLFRKEFNMLCLFHSLFNDAKILVIEYTVKIKVVLVQIMKTWASGGTPPRILNPGTSCEWSASCSGSFTSGKERPVHIEEESGWVPQTFWTIWKGKIHLPLLGVDLRFLGRLTRSLVTAPT
jgi:hypothetical protein